MCSYFKRWRTFSYPLSVSTLSQHFSINTQDLLCRCDSSAVWARRAYLM